MDPKLLCPTLTIMLTKTIKALCEVNIKFDKKLEISGSLHVRSDGEKILTCLIDEDSTRTCTGSVLQQRSTPETALAQQSAVMALLTASQQMAANRSPGLISPPARNSTPGDNSRGVESHMTVQVTKPQQAQPSITNSTQEHHQQNFINTHAHQMQLQHQHPQHLLPHPTPPPPLMINPDHLHNPLPPVNSFMQHKNDREVLLGMLQDKTKKSEGHHNAHTPIQVHVKKEPVDPQPKPAQQPPPTTAPQQQQTIPLQQQQQITTVNGGLPPLAALPPFPVLVGGNTWAPGTQGNIVIATSGVTGAPKPATPKSDPDSPPRENEYVTTINSKGQKKFQCMFCGILLSTKNYLKNHINAVHTKARVYPCEICERYFYSAGALRIHKLRHHWAGSKKHKCAHCQESFLLPVELRRHLVKKHGDTSGGHSEDENGELTRGNVKSDSVAGGLTIQQIQQMQLREQLRAQQHIYEQEQAIHNLQRHMSDQNSPIELSGRGDSLSDEREPGELLNDDINTHMTVAPVLLEVQTLPSEHHLLHHHSPIPKVIVEPEAPPDVVHEDMEEELHPNQNEIGIPDDEVHEIHEVTLEEAEPQPNATVEYVQQPQTVGDGGD